MALRGIISPAQPSAFLAPDDVDTNPLVSLELGGVAINDPTQGRMVRVWMCYLNGQDVNVAPQIEGTPVTTVFTATGLIKQLSLGFDSNMSPVIAYTEDDIVKLRWFNTLTSLFQTDSYPLAVNGRCSTDEKRAGLDGLSDVIFSYVESGVLYYRQQRDRYLTAYVVGAVPAGFKLRITGKNVGNRFQFLLST